MADKPGLWTYLRAAFNARPFGMFVAPNWIGLGTFGLLGLVDPGFWVVGAGLELGYLFALGTSARFQRVVSAQADSGKHTDWDKRVDDSLKQLSDGDRRRYQALAAQFRTIIEMQMHGTSDMPHGLDTQSESLARLLWMYLRLLVARHTIANVLGVTAAPAGADATGPDAALRTKLADLERRAASETRDAELRRSLEGQIEILRQRLDHRSEGQQKVSYIDAELARIEQQGELIKEQAALSTDPALLSHRIDEIAATLGGTSQWIRDQQQVYGAMGDLLGDAPRPVIDTRAKENQ